MHRTIACSALIALFILFVPLRSLGAGPSDASSVAEPPARGAPTSVGTDGQAQPELVRKRWRFTLPTRHHRDPDLTPDQRSWYPRRARADLQWVELRNLPDADLERKLNRLLRERAGHQGSAEATTEKRWLDISSAVKHAFMGRGLLSVAYDIDTYGHGAATSNSSLAVLNYDLHARRELTFDDLFPPAARPTLDRLITERLDQMKIEHEFHGLEKPECFYFDRRSLTLCFGRRDIAAGALGNIHVRLPLTRVAPLFARNDVTHRLVRDASAASGSSRSEKTPPR